MSTAHPADQHARQTARAKVRTTLIGLALMLLCAATVAVGMGFSPGPLIGVQVALLAGLVTLNRIAVPGIERWGRGADGEEHVGRALDGLKADGWQTIHDVDTGRGSIDTIVIGPGGLFTIEVKSHGGRLRADRIEPQMLRQAYAQKKCLEGIVGQRTTALLVLSRAHLVGEPVSRQRGVVVLPARMLADHLRRRPVTLSAEEIQALHDRLGYAFDGLAAAV
jgi:hypothetical protein